MNAPNPAVRLFESLASSAWNWLGDARQLGLIFSEDTISDLTALEIARDASNEAAVRRVSKGKEKYVGFESSLWTSYCKPVRNAVILWRNGPEG